MANMTFKAKLLPAVDGSDDYTLGSTNVQWKVGLANVTSLPSTTYARYGICLSYTDTATMSKIHTSSFARVVNFPAGYTSIDVGKTSISTGFIALRHKGVSSDSGYYHQLFPAKPTARREIELPDASGTIALTSDLSNFVTLNNLNNYVTLNTTQTITGQKTFTGNVYIGSGGRLNGSATNGGMNSILIGDDCWLGDCNNGGIIAVKGNNSNSQAGFFFYGSNGTDLGHLWYTGTGHSNVAFYGACWNDYAEMRNIPEANDSYDNSTERKIKLAGRCVREVGDGTMVLSTSRLERGCKIISDTFGFNIGETDDCKTPIAVSGRVLVYLSECREVAKQHIGWPVCSGPNGTVSIMTEEEEEKYPSRIVGTISEIPEYETWGSGNVLVDGRIWIYVR